MIPRCRASANFSTSSARDGAGRTYLFETDGFLFESPVNWYTNKQMWDMAPAYQSAREMPLNLPAYTSCLHCHVSGMQAPLKGTENRYPDPAVYSERRELRTLPRPGAVHAGGGRVVDPSTAT